VQRTTTHYSALQHTATTFCRCYCSGGHVFSTGTRQYNAPHCNALQRKTLHNTAPHCTTLQRTTTPGNALQHTRTHYNILERTATHCNALQRTATHCNALQSTATHCNALQCIATHCNVLQHIASASAVDGSVLERQGCRFFFERHSSISRPALHSTTTQHTATLCTVLQHSGTHSKSLQCSATNSNSLQYTAGFVAVDGIYCSKTCSRTGTPQNNREADYGVPVVPRTTGTPPVSRLKLVTTPQHTATHRNTLQPTAPHCTTRQHTATHGNTRPYTATHCNTLLHATGAAAVDGGVPERQGRRLFLDRRARATRNGRSQTPCRIRSPAQVHCSRVVPGTNSEKAAP